MYPGGGIAEKEVAAAARTSHVGGERMWLATSSDTLQSDESALLRTINAHFCCDRWVFSSDGVQDCRILTDGVADFPERAKRTIEKQANMSTERLRWRKKTRGGLGKRRRFHVKASRFLILVGLAFWLVYQQPRPHLPGRQTKLSVP